MQVCSAACPHARRLRGAALSGGGFGQKRAAWCPAARARLAATKVGKSASVLYTMSLIMLYYYTTGHGGPPACPPGPLRGPRGPRAARPIRPPCVQVGVYGTDADVMKTSDWWRSLAYAVLGRVPTRSEDRRRLDALNACAARALRSTLSAPPHAGAAAGGARCGLPVPPLRAPAPAWPVPGRLKAWPLCCSPAFLCMFGMRAGCRKCPPAAS